MSDSERRAIDHEQLLRQALDQPEGDAGHGPRVPELEELSPHFPDFEILALAGRGGMAAVYKAVHKRLDRTVALKVLARELATDPEFGERFLREARALAALNHPHVLTVYDFGEREGFHYLVTEFVDGVTLRQLMAMGELSPAEALRIAPQVCEALQYAHEHGVVHRDVKPENILIDTAGQVKIADFGLAKLMRKDDRVGLTRSTAVFGTPHYMAPEQWRGSAGVDHRADIYSLGVVLYEMLTGQLPLGHFDPPSRRPGVPRGLDEVVRRTLAQRPENRYQRAGDVQTDVELQARSMPEAPRAGSGAGDASSARLVKGPFVAVAVLLAGVIALAAVIWIVERGAAERHRYDSRVRAYDETVAALADADTTTGRLWADDMPGLPAAPDLPWLSFDGARVLVTGGAVSVLLFVLVLGFGSMRRIRNAGGGLRGLPFAVVVAWLVPIGVAVSLLLWPILSIRDHDLKRVVLSFAPMVLFFAGTWFLMLETRRQRKLVERLVPMRFGGGLLATGAVLAALLLAGSATGAFLIERTAAEHSAAATPEPKPTLPQDLVGRTVAFVIERLGPPVAIEASREGQVWSYRDESGEPERSAVTISGDHVLATSATARVLRPNARPASGPYLGQPVAELTRELGAPIDQAVGTIVRKLVYRGELKVAVHDGRVVGITRD
jgi:tRNA A-37 threonylcarbamoyl transferase component Bud32